MSKLQLIVKYYLVIYEFYNEMITNKIYHFDEI